MVWGLLAVVGWFVVLLPAYVVVAEGPALVQALFGDDEAPNNAVARPDAAHILTPAEIEALGKIAPAAGGATDTKQ